MVRIWKGTLQAKGVSSLDKIDFTQIRRGVVVSNQDPRGLGRCRVRVFGVYDEIPDDHIPWAHYADPLMVGNRGMGGFFIPPEGSKVWCFFEEGNHMMPVYFAGAPSALDLPDARSNPPGEGTSYPNNRCFVSASGHLIEFDDSPGNERVRIRHRSGTEQVMYANGDMVERVVGNHTRIVNGTLTEVVVGDVTRTCGGDRREEVNGDGLTLINGDNGVMSGGSSSYLSGGTMTIDGSITNINKGGMAIIGAGAAVGFDVPESVQVSPRNAVVVIEEVGSRAAFDEEGETIPADWPAEESLESAPEPTRVETAPTPPPPLTEECELIETIDYNYQLSPNFKLKDLTTGAVFPHSVAAQNGLSVSDIICNLKHLCINVLEPLKAQYPNIRINSGFRRGSGNSQHNKGQAVDIQVPGAPASLYSDMAAWIMKNVNFDQFILEHGKSVWLHISYDPQKTSQRGMRGTYYPRKTPNYEWGKLVNYYENGRVIT